MAFVSNASQEAQLRAVGWSPSPGDSVAAAWARTATTAQGGTQPNPTAAASPTAAAPAAPGAPAAPAQQGFNKDAATLAAQLADNAAQRAYNTAKLQLDGEDVAFKKAQAEWQRVFDTESRSFNQGVTAAGLTGMYNGAPTLAAQQQQADITGYYNAPSATAAAPLAGPAAAGPYTPDQINAIDAQMVQQIGGSAWKGGQFKADVAAGVAIPDAIRRAADTRAAYTMPAVPSAPATASSAVPGAMPGAAGVGTPTFAREQENNKQTQAYLSLIAGLRGPSDYGQYLKVLGSTPNGMRDLVAGAAGKYQLGGGASGVAPTPASLGGLVGDATSGTSGGTDYASYMNTAAGLVAPNQIAPQAYNAMNPTQRQLLTGMYEAQGWMPQDVTDMYAKSLPKYAYGGGAGRIAQV